MGADVPKLTEAQKAQARRWVDLLDKQRSTLRDEVEADLEPYRNLTPEQESRLRIGVVRGAWRLLQERPDKQEILDHRDPPAPDFEKIWRRLVEEGRALREKNGDPTR
jgi:hypothetical protein